MLDVDLHPLNSRRTSVAQWFYQALGEPEVRLRVRLRGNSLHILCESPHRLQATTIMPRLVKALQSKPENLSRLSRAYEHPIYTVILYSRVFGQERPDWVEPIVLNQLKSTATSKGKTELSSRLSEATPISNKELARSGQAEAIASYLSDSLSHLGVSVRVHIQKLVPSVKSTTVGQGSTISQRLWVICYCNYSPDPSLLAEPIAQQLRDLALEGFQEAVIRSQVSGEETADWALRVDLTPPTQMLRDWARWGDVSAIARLLNESAPKGTSVRVVEQEKTLHIFCSLTSTTAKKAPVQSTTLAAIAEELTAIAPQGRETATLYGIKGSDANIYSFDTPEFLDFQNTVAWIERINLPAATNPTLAVSPTTLAIQGNSDALTFLLQRLLNPDLEWRLATGGIRIKLCHQQDLLHIMCEAVVCPAQDDVIQILDP
ncbi:MAG: DUF1574 domain-containing protein, partial [Cyanobacteriota bacterium]